MCTPINQHLRNQRTIKKPENHRYVIGKCCIYPSILNLIRHNRKIFTLMVLFSFWQRFAIIIPLFLSGPFLQILFKQFFTCASWAMHHLSVHLESSATNTWFPGRWKRMWMIKNYKINSGKVLSYYQFKNFSPKNCTDVNNFLVTF